MFITINQQTGHSQMSIESIAVKLNVNTALHHSE